MTLSKQAVLWLPLLLPAYVLRSSIGPLPTTALEVAFFVVALYATWTNRWSIWRKGFDRLKPWHAPAGLWIFATVIAVFVAPNHVAAFGLWRAFVLEPILFAILLAGTMETEKDRETVVTALIASVTFVAAYAVFQFTTNIGIPHPWDTATMLTRRATGPFPFPNALSLFCAPIAALCFGQFCRRPASSILWIGFVSATLATLLAKSVGGSLGILCAVVFALLWKKKTRIVTLVVIAITIIGALAISPIRTRIVSTLSFNEWSGQVRTLIWKETWNMLKDRPVFGAGFGAYPTVIVPYHKATFIEIFQYPHNILLNLWSETGLLGIIAFGWICTVWIRRSKQKDEHNGSSSFSPIFLLPLIAILIQGLVDVPYFKNDLSFLFWILVVLV